MKEIRKILESETLREILFKAPKPLFIESDPEINGAIIGQIQLLIPGIPDLQPNKVDQILMAGNAVSLKVRSMKYHYTRFKELQEQRVKDVISDNLILESIKQGLTINEHELACEFEGFCFQLKSMLDMLVKITAIIFTGKRMDLPTYGDAGNKVIKFLEQVKKNKKLVPNKLSPQRIDWLIELIQEARSPWLEPLIEWRDNISHFEPYVRFGLSWDNDNNLVIGPAANSESSKIQILEIMENELIKVILFANEFIARTISCAIPINQGLRVLDENEKRYFGAKIGMNLHYATWRLSSNIIITYSEKDIEEAALQREEINKSILERMSSNFIKNNL